MHLINREEFNEITHIGGGHNSFVYSAINKETEEKVAIKMIKLEGETEEKYIRSEINIMSKVDHPNLLRLNKVTEEENWVLIYQKFCEDGDLFKYLRSPEYSELSREGVQDYLEQISEGVAYLHRSTPQIVHRDLKPSNIFKAGEQLLIADFGISKLCTETQLLAGPTPNVRGTLLYVPPEKLEALMMTSVKEDIWALGVIFYELIEGEHPFSTNSPLLLRTLQFTGYPPLSGRFKDDPIFLLLISRCLVYDPEHRADIEEVLDILGGGGGGGGLCEGGEVDIQVDPQYVQPTVKMGPIVQEGLLASQRVDSADTHVDSFQDSKEETKFSSHKLTRTITPTDELDYALGGVIGAFIGDSLLTPELPEGRLTSDGEMAICLAHGLARGKMVMNLSEIARFYALWFKQPNNISYGGKTIQTALKIADPQNPDGRLLQAMAFASNKSSQSNGSLMRILPLCVFMRRLESIRDIEKAVKEEASITHSHENIFYASTAYCVAVRSLINTKGDRIEAYREAMTYIEKCECEEVKGWFQDIKKSKDLSAKKKSGWVRIGLHYAFLYLKAGLNYTQAMRGMIGAAIGFSALPSQFRNGILRSNPSKAGKYKRPLWLIPKFCIQSLIAQIYANAPLRLLVENTPILQPTIIHYFDTINC